MAVLGGGFVLFLAFYFFALECDESCDDRSSLWMDDPDAWQWDAQFALAAAAVAAGLAGALLLFRREGRTGAWLFGAGVVGCLAWAAWMIPF